MKKYRFLSLLLCLSVVCSSFLFPSLAIDDPQLECRNAILFDANNGETLYGKGAHEKAYPASITKVMTALLVLDAVEAGQLSLETMVTASQSAMEGLSIYGSTANIKAGETMSVKNLLYCLLLPSANEAANILAETVSGSVSEFMVQMNRKASELGAQGTHLTNPHGLHDDNHYTTAYDIALFMTAALKYPLFRTIIDTPSYTIPPTNQTGERFYYNTNGLISNLYYAGYVYDKCIGGKTGTTEEAGRCLVSAAEVDDTLLISVILGSGVITTADGTQKQGQFTESTKLLKWGFSNFERVTITRGSDPVESVAVTLSRQADQVMLKPQGSITRTLPKDLDLNEIETQITLFATEVEAPVAEGQILGTMKLSYQGESYGTLDLVAVTAVERSELLYKKAQFLDFFDAFGVRLALVAIFLTAAIILFKVLVLNKKRRYNHANRKTRGSYRGSGR